MIIHKNPKTGKDLTFFERPFKQLKHEKGQFNCRDVSEGVKILTKYYKCCGKTETQQGIVCLDYNICD